MKSLIVECVQRQAKRVAAASVVHNPDLDHVSHACGSLDSYSQATAASMADRSDT